MQVQLNTDKHIVGSPRLLERVEHILQQELKHLTEELTRIEVHINDENSLKGGDNDKRCLLEARTGGLPPITAEHRAESVDLALRGAAEQLGRVIKSSLGKLRERNKHAEPLKRVVDGSEI